MKNIILYSLLLSVIISCRVNVDVNGKDSFKASTFTIEEINNFLNKWHNAAAIADEDIYFDMIKDDGIFIGTDAKEIWSKEEFYSFAIKYFDREKAWDFKTIDRNVYFSEEGKYIWFDELLDTWMGECRGSGVLEVKNEELKIAHYVLSITIPNDVVKDIIKVVENHEAKDEH